ncbi:MAG: flagellar biosynthesis anti-sigma factor FlgM [Gammaproteobacteria bacterium]|nr:flagellar biosynthesis anti-sigma factor FlgM [Gammaproteobacteria bacterium]
MSINPLSSAIGAKTNHISDSQQSKNVGHEVNRNNTAQSGNAAPAASDTVSITGTASQLQALEKQLASLPVVDVQRVDSVKREISNGTFEINPPRIADKMIQIESAISQRLG